MTRNYENSLFWASLYREESQQYRRRRKEVIRGVPLFRINNNNNNNNMGAEDPKRLIGTPAATTSATPSAPPPPPQQHQYGTFQGVACYSQPPVVGFPQPTPPPVTTASPYHYPVGYQSVHGYVVAEGRPFREERLPCCGIGIGWPLFIAGFFFASIPWYVGAIILLCGRVDYREKPGLVACMIATILALIAIVFGVTGGVESW